MATVNLGSIKFKWKGTYAGGTAYTIDDVVSYNGSSYICIQASTGNLPTDTAYFEQMSQKGTDGTNGTDGTDVGTVITTQGDILYRDGSGLQRLGAGTSGQALITQGTGANPIWGDTDSSTFAQAIVSTTGSTNFGGSTNDTTERYNGLTVDITPTSASNKILIMFGQQQRFHQGGGGNGDGGGFHNYLKRGNSSTTIGSIGDAISGFGGTQSSLWYQTYCFWNNSTSQIETCYMTYSYLDTPNTTSLCRYFTSVRNAGQGEDLRWMVDGGTTYLYAIEIKS